MPRSNSNGRTGSRRLVAVMAGVLAITASAGAQTQAQQASPASAVPAAPVSTPTPPVAGSGAPSGSIFNVHAPYSPLTSGQRASQVGDVLTVVLVERTQGSVTNAGGIDRDGGFGLVPPSTGPLSLVSPSDLSMSGNANFAGRGQSAQANQLTGDITVRVVGVEPNGDLQVAGTKRIRINRGDETIRVRGIVRPIDISNDNRVLSIRIADAEIEYSGRGEIARGSRQGWLMRFFTRISPF